MKKVWSFILSISILAYIFASEPIQVTAATSGTCGNSITWTLTEGMLTISGYGSMYVQNDYYYPWLSYCNEIEEICIEQGITEITDAFKNCNNLEKVYIPANITIWPDAFENCPNLKIVYFGGNRSQWENIYYAETIFSEQKIYYCGIPNIGDYIQMGSYYNSPILWRCVAYEKIEGYDEKGNPIVDSSDTVQEYQEGYLPLILADRIISIKPFDAGTSENSNSNSHSWFYKNDPYYDYRTNYGTDYWEDSNIRSWLNSTASSGNIKWLCGNPPYSEFIIDNYNSYDNEAGFLSNFSSDELSSVKAITQKSIVGSIEAQANNYDIGNQLCNNNSYDIDAAFHYPDNYKNSYAKYTTDKMFLLDIRQIGNVAFNSRNGGKLDSQYYMTTPTEQAVVNSQYKNDELNKDNYWNYWLRTPYGDYRGYYVRNVHSNGNTNAYPAATGTLGVRPAFYLNTQNLRFVGAGTKDIPYAMEKTNKIKDVRYEDIIVSVGHYERTVLSINYTPIANANVTCNGITKKTDENGEVIYSAKEADYNGYSVAEIDISAEGYFNKTGYVREAVSQDGSVKLSLAKKDSNLIYISSVTMNDVKDTSYDLTYYRTVNIYKTDTDNYTFSVDVDWNNHEAGEIYLQTRNGDKKFKFEEDNTLTIPLAQKFDVGDELVIWAYTADKSISMSKILNVDICVLPENYSLKMPSFSSSETNEIAFFDCGVDIDIDGNKGLESGAKVSIVDNKLVLEFDRKTTDPLRWNFLEGMSRLSVGPEGKLEIPLRDGAEWSGEIGMSVGIKDLIHIQKSKIVKLTFAPYVLPLLFKANVDAGIKAKFSVSGTLDNPIYFADSEGGYGPWIDAHAFAGLGEMVDGYYDDEYEETIDSMEISVGGYGDFEGEFLAELPLDKESYSKQGIEITPDANGELGVEITCKAFIINVNYDFPIGQFIWDENGIEWGWANEVALLSLNDKDIRLFGREYLNVGGGFVGDQQSIALFDLEVTNKDEKMIYENIFRNSEAKLQKASGKEILYFLVDDTSRETQNGLKLVYSSKNADGTWTLPEAVNDDRTLDSIIETDGEFVIWEDTKTELSSDVSLTDVFNNTEISVAKFNGASFDSVRLSDNDIYDFSPVIKTNGNTAVAAWLSNDNADLTSKTGVTNLHYALYDGINWSEVEKIENIGEVSRVTTSYNGDNAYIFYKKNGVLYSVTTSDGTIAELPYTSVGHYTVSTYDNNICLAYFNSERKLTIVEDVFGETKETIINEETNSNSIPAIASNGENMYITWLSHKDGFDVLSGVRYDNGDWSDVINFVDDEMNVKKPSLIVNEDGSFSASYFKTGEYQVQEDGSIYSGATNLYVNNIVPSYDIAVVEETVSYDDVAYAEGENVDVNFDVENIGEKDVEGFNIEIYEGDSLVHSESNTDILKAGEIKNISAKVEQLKNGELKNITVKVIPTSVDDFDESDNSITFEIGTFDPEVQSAYFTYNDYTYSVNADIKNNGSAISDRCLVQIRKDSEDGEVVYETIIENLKPLETVFVTYEMPIDTKLDNSYITVSSENDANEYNNYSVAVYENFDEETKYDVELNISEAVVNEKNVNITINGINKTQNEIGAAMILAAYDTKGKLLKLKVINNISLKEGENNLDTTFDCSEITGEFSLKTILWGSSANIVPLCETVEVNLNV